LGSGPVFCFASLFSRDGETQIWPGDLRFVFWFWCFLLCCVIRFAVFLMRPLCFMLIFLIRLPAYPNVRTESQSDIGHNRGKKKCKICFADKLIMVGIFDIFLPSGEINPPKDFFWMLVPASTFEGVESEYRLVDGGISSCGK
jgi:hypothetical protein